MNILQTWNKILTYYFEVIVIQSLTDFFKLLFLNKCRLLSDLTKPCIMNETNLTFWESSFSSFDKTKCLKCCSCSPWDYLKVSSTHSTGPVHFYTEISDHKTIDYPSDCCTKETKVWKLKLRRRKRRKTSLHTYMLQGRLYRLCSCIAIGWKECCIQAGLQGFYYWVCSQEGKKVTFT